MHRKELVNWINKWEMNVKTVKFNIRFGLGFKTINRKEEGEVK